MHVRRVSLRGSSQNLVIWASQRMLFDPTKTFCFSSDIYFIAKVLSCFGIRTEEIQLTALRNFQLSKAIVVAAKKIPLNVPNHRFETWSLHVLDWQLIYKYLVALYTHHFREQFTFSVFFSLQVCFWTIYEMKLKFSFILGYFVWIR